MPRVSAGIALYRRRGPDIEIFLVHFGGPFWAKKDDGAWTFPKGEHDDSEDPLAAARREFREETGFEIDGDFLPLDPVPLHDKSHLASEWAQAVVSTMQSPSVKLVGWRLQDEVSPMDCHGSHRSPPPQRSSRASRELRARSKQFGVRILERGAQ